MPRLWDDSLYAGCAEHYRIGRLPYPQRLADALGERLSLDGRGTLLDLGCGPGSLTLLLAPLFAHVLAVDADAQMLAVGADEARRRGVANVEWVRSAAEDLPEDLPRVDVVTLAQSFHWMDRRVVARKVRGWLAPDGCCVHVGATTREGASDTAGLPHPLPPRDRINDLVRTYLGPRRRAGQQAVTGSLPNDEEQAFRGARLTGPEIIPAPGGDAFIRTEDEVIASVLSLSSAAPHLFGDRLPSFVGDLRDLLRAASPAGTFAERLQDMRLLLWRP
ncbi:MAG: class I SAM-dependent methyltransferase [Frankiaceae bacterium]